VDPWIWYGEWFRLPAYFTGLVVGLSLGVLFIRREALRLGLEPRIPVDAAIFVLPAALLGARLAHVLIEQPRFYVEHPELILSPDGGLVFYGGFAGAALAGLSYARRVGVSGWLLADIYAPATALGLVWGRMGCLGGGCCFGRPADWPFGFVVPWAIHYRMRGEVPDDLLGVPLHPAPLYEAVGCLALFVGLSALARDKRFDGQVILAFGLGYGLWRSFVECFRADDVRGMFFGGWLSTSQIIGLSSAAFCALMLARRRRQVVKIA
jgi:phosphatidylglycerol:prolipoprotein diacylglycerol transferase